LPSGIIIKGIGGFYYVSVLQGVYQCKARGVFRKKGLAPLVGDKVIITVVDDERKIGSIDCIEPRSSELVRPAVANVDQVAAVIAIQSPEPDLMLLDKLLITAEKKGISPVICVNKIDLDTTGKYEEFFKAYIKTGYRIILTSFKTNRGYEELKEALRDRVTVFAGQSGVGKSTILNKIMNSRVMETGNISGKINRGKHTTRHAELVKLEAGGYIVDTPGFSSFEITDICHEELHLFYPEFRNFLKECRFSRCSHISEPQCGVKNALDNGFIDKGRYERYTQMYYFLKANYDNRYKK
jgi:ribosome biogenesis GTPase